MLAFLSRFYLITALALAGCGLELEDGSVDADVSFPKPDDIISVSEIGGLGATALAIGEQRLVIAHHALNTGSIILTQAEGTQLHSSQRINPAEHKGSPYLDMALESNGLTLQVVWFDELSSSLYWARGQLGGYFRVKHVDGSIQSPAGTHVSLALDSRDMPHLAYRDEASKRLRYATSHDLTSDSPPWEIQEVSACSDTDLSCQEASQTDYGEWAQIAVVTSAGGQQTPIIAFYDRLGGDLKLTSKQPDGRWALSILDGRHPVTGVDTGDVGRFISLALTPNRRIGLAYFDASRGALRYLAPDEEPRTLDFGIYNIDGRQRRATVGQYVSLRYDSLGRAHFIYTDSTNLKLRYLTLSNAGTSTPIELDLPPGAFLNLAQVSPSPYGVYARFATERFDAFLAPFTLTLPSFYDESQ